MEKKISNCKTYEITAPSTDAYKGGALSFVFEDNMPAVIKKIDFKIDNTKYYINLLRVHGNCIVTWMFQKEGSLKSVSSEELCKILQLTQDVTKRYPMRPAYQKLLWALPDQAKIYLKAMDKATPKAEKRALLKELSKKNNLIDNIGAVRCKEIREAEKAE